MESVNGFTFEMSFRETIFVLWGVSLTKLSSVRGILRWSAFRPEHTKFPVIGYEAADQLESSLDGF